jgi:DNA-binding FadR family transcriptional regulator
VEADAEFHRRLVEPLNNSLLVSLLAVFWKVYRQINLEVGVGAEDLQETAALHRQIYAAVAGGDKALAAERLNRHFDGIRDRIYEVIRQ